MLPIFLSIESEDERNLAENLYLTYKSKMYRIAHAVLHNKEDAEDVVMDSVCKIVKHISRFLGADRNKTESLIVIIVRNTAINRYHYNQHRQHIPMEEYSNMIPDDSGSPSDILIEQDRFDELLQKIRSLDAIYRDVLLLKYLYEYDNSLIASLTGVAEATVRVRLMRAKRLLEQILKGGGTDE